MHNAVLRILAHQALNLANFHHVRQILRPVVWHHQNQIIASTANCDIDDVLLVDERALAIGNAGRRIKQRNNHLAFIALETVHCSR